MPSITGINGAGSGLPEPAGFGVLGDSDTGPGVAASSRSGPALQATSVNNDSGFFQSQSGDGVVSFTNAQYATAMIGIGNGQAGTGVYGNSETGVYGYSDNGTGVWGDTATSQGAGVHGRTFAAWGAGVKGETSGPGYAIWGLSTTSFAGLFEGNVLMAGAVYIYGSLSKPGGSFKIDHPLDPANKYLSHSFVESPDMMNIYNGMVALDDQGAATVELPEWFDALNREFRYQLTPIGSSAPELHVAREIEQRSFRIAGGRPNGKVSWQVTGVRHDNWANANRVQVEEAKPDVHRGYYLHPDLYGEPDERKIMPGPRPGSIRRPDERPAHRPRP